MPTRYLCLLGLLSLVWFGAFVNPCKVLPRLCVRLGNGGLSNRLYALVSSTILAALTNRVLELDWVVDKSLGVPFHDLFEPVHEYEFYKVHHIRGFMYNKNDSHANMERFEVGESLHDNFTTADHTVCHIYLDHHHPTHFKVLVDFALFEHVDENCDTIYLESNQYFAPALYGITEHWLGAKDSKGGVWRLSLCLLCPPHFQHIVFRLFSLFTPYRFSFSSCCNNT